MGQNPLSQPLNQFDDPADVVDTRPVYRLSALDLYDIPEARDRILRLLAESGEALSLEQLLPGPNQQTAQTQTETRLRRRSAWSATFVASLELAKQGDVALAQAENFDPIIVSVSSSDQPLLSSMGETTSTERSDDAGASAPHPARLA
ncbi:hypothetical protein AruPA_21265 [Acidiphilium sp. PA]|uniref:hypothetical protein n=1 Tax=Acidiphilium sp. PA TaxID=2871705 RepID=UPI002244D01A|nr:hypothetical protein [Acidiphilium sp. PA]MCW8309545.1 hypothetical protein [Acidiphilium sp. PA]